MPALTREYVYLGGKLLTSLAPSAPATQKAQLVSPAVNATLTGTTATFAWTPGVGVAFYWLYIGSTPGTWDILSRDMGATGLSTVVTNLPADGRTLYVRVLSHIGSWQSLDYTLTAVTARAELTAPTPGSTLTSSTATFAWTSGIGVAFYWLYIGSTPGTWDILSRDMGATGLSTVVTGLPNDGRTLYVRLHSHIGEVWQYHDYVLTAVTAELAVLTSPTPGSTLTGTTATFAWTPGVDVAFYWLYIGSTPGTWDILSRDMGATGLSTVVTGLPSDGRTLYVRLFSHIGVWQYHDDTLTAFGGEVALVAPDQTGGGATQFPPEPKPAVVRVPKITPSPVPPPDATTSTDGGGMAMMMGGPATWIATLIGTGTGTVTSSPSGLSCTGGEVSCAGPFDVGTPVTFTATAGSGSTFGGWAGACTGMASTCQLTVTEAQTVIAIFAGPPAVTYYHTDILGSVRAITDATGAVLTRHDYFPFGESTSPLTGDPRRFTGKELDPETALQYFDARYYRNVWGRFTTIDPGQASGSTEDPQGWNAYAYARNNPLRFVDPTGLAYQTTPEGDPRYVWGGEVSDSKMWELLDKLPWGYTCMGGGCYDRSFGSSGWVGAWRDGQWVALFQFARISEDRDGMSALAKGIGDMAGSGVKAALAIGALHTTVLAATAAQVEVTTLGRGMGSVGKTFTHAFKPGHNLGPVIARYGSKIATFSAVVEAARQAIARGATFPMTVNVGGISVSVTGIVSDGLPVVSNFWIPR